MNGVRSWTMLAVVAIALASGALAASPALDSLRGFSLDALTGLRWLAFGARRAPAASPTVVIALDQETYRTPPFMGTPTVTWTREIGRVIGATIEGGAKVVGFDVIFPTSIEESQISFDDQTIGARMRGFDRDFLRALALGARAGKIVLGEVQLGDELVLPAAGQRAAVGQQRNIRSLNVYSESDGVVRRTPLLLTLDGKPTPSMSLELAARALGAAPQIEPDQSVSLAGFRIPGYVPDALTLNFEGGSDDIPTYSFADLHACLEKGDSEFFRRNFDGKIVLLGSRLDFEDDKITSKRFAVAGPRSHVERCSPASSLQEPIVRASIDGVFVHATAVNNLIRREAVAELGRLPTWLIATIAAMPAAFAALWLSPLIAALSFALLALAWTAGATAAFNEALALPLFEPLVAGLIALIATTGFRVFVSDRDKRFLRRAFELYLAPPLIAKMLASSKPPALGGEMREVTLFFSDIAGFSSFAEKIEPTALVALMNRYLSAMTEIIEAHGGFVDKYIGDAIVALFGAPAEGADHAAQAVRAALACCAELRKLNQAASARDGQELAHRIGLNSGRALVGNIGSMRRFNYTAMGDAVNLAARLEGANKYFGTCVLASQSTMAQTGAAFVWREIDAIRVRGRDEPVRVFEPLAEAGQTGERQLACAASYAQGLEQWRRRDFSGAAASFANCADADPPSVLFMKRAERLSRDPPGETWEPIQTLEEK